jgi:outer membrane protein TolC
VAELGFTWNLLDFGLGHYNTTQQANRVLIAAEKRRKAMHVLMQDVRTAYWRAASAQKLRVDVEKTIALAEDALTDSRKVEAERVRNPLDALRYQRQLLENLRLLEAIDQELSSAQVELASLINAPVGQAIQIAETDIQNVDAGVLKVTVQAMEEAALAQNADLREQHYNARIARDETRKTLVRLFPNVSFSYGIKYDSDSYLVNNNWNEAGLQLSFNLFNVLTGPTQIKLAEAGVALADQRRMATQMAVLTQVHLARLQLLNARNQFDRADAIYATDLKIAEHVRNRESAQAQSKLDSVSNATAAILSLLRRYQALAQVQSAENRLLASMGLEPKIGSTGELSLAQLTAQLKDNGTLWTELQNAKPQIQPNTLLPVAAQPEATK